MVTAEQDAIAGASLIEVRLVVGRWMVVRVEMMRLGRKVKNGLSPKICPSPKKTVGSSDFLTPQTRLAFSELR